MAEAEDAQRLEQLREEALKGATSIYDVAKLYKSPELESLLKVRSFLSVVCELGLTFGFVVWQDIDAFWDPAKKEFSSSISIDLDKEYEVIVKSNELALAVQEEITRGFRFIRDIYTKKFPELEGIIVFPMDYVKIVKKIGNETDLARVDLNGIIQQSNIITLTLTASNTTGKPLSPPELQKCMEGCDVCIELDTNRQRVRILGYFVSNAESHHWPVRFCLTLKVE